MALGTLWKRTRSSAHSVLSLFLDVDRPGQGSCNSSSLSDLVDTKWRKANLTADGQSDTATDRQISRASARGAKCRNGAQCSRHSDCDGRSRRGNRRHAIVFDLPACRNREVVMIRLVNPVVTLNFHQIRSRGRKLPPAAEEFTSFLKNYIARWAGRAGVL